MQHRQVKLEEIYVKEERDLEERDVEQGSLEWLHAHDVLGDVRGEDSSQLLKDRSTKLSRQYRPCVMAAAWTKHLPNKQERN